MQRTSRRCAPLAADACRLGWLTPRHRGEGRSRHLAQLLRAGSSSGARSPFVGVLLLFPSAASRLEALHPAHQGARGPSPFGALGHSPSRCSTRRVRIVVGTRRHVSSHWLRASFARDRPSPCNAQRQARTALSGVSETRHSCEPPRGFGSRVLHRPYPSSAQPASFRRQPNPGVQWTRCARH